MGRQAAERFLHHGQLLFARRSGSAGGDLMVLWYDTRIGGSRIYARKYFAARQGLPARSPRYPRRGTGHGTRSWFPWGGAVSCSGKSGMSSWPSRPTCMPRRRPCFRKRIPEGKWSRLPYVVMQWRPPRDESGIVGYATLANEIPDFNPTVVNMKPNITDGEDHGEHDRRHILLPHPGRGRAQATSAAPYTTSCSSRSTRCPDPSSSRPRTRRGSRRIGRAGLFLGYRRGGARQGFHVQPFDRCHQDAGHLHHGPGRRLRRAWSRAIIFSASPRWTRRTS